MQSPVVSGASVAPDPGRTTRSPIGFPAPTRWKLNLAEGKPTHVRLRGCDISLRPELVRGPAEVDRLLGVMSANNPMVGRFVPIPKRADGHYDRERLDLAIRHGFRIVRWSAGDETAREAMVAN
jgi:hypothetical protein